MIGVTADESLRDSVAEFFELFKTPWEWRIPGKSYRVMLIADGSTEPTNTDLAIVCGATEHPIDRRLGLVARDVAGPVLVRFGEWLLPLYGRTVSFDPKGGRGLLSAPHGVVDYSTKLGTTELRRVGYDVFAEIAHLLTQGQPQSRAATPTLELHIALIRQYLEEASVPYVEVPPRPDGKDFLCCLTHDIDFFGLRRHICDQTMAGYLARATVGTAADLFRGRRSFRESVRNWLSALSLPMVYAGAMPDPWDPFRDYAVADRGRKSTFFLVPFKNRPGVSPDGRTVPSRSVAYGIDDLKSEVQQATKPQTEFAVHGLDAWRDVGAGTDERRAIGSVTGRDAAGVRMHWLYFSSDSPRHLEDAGYEYDSTCGYNDAVGFRAGTMQAFRLPGTKRLLELPLAIMDTALFYPDRMGLSRQQAAETCSSIVRTARRFGGALVINWHDRSLAPERQWGQSYDRLQRDVESNGGAFTTADEAVQWFRWRRNIAFSECSPDNNLCVQAPRLPEGLPSARLTIRHGSSVRDSAFSGGTSSLTL